jgi:hypothetical protein
MSTALVIMAVITVSVCQVYAWLFAYKPRLERPIKYETAKHILNRASAVLVLLSAGFLVADDAGQWGAALIFGSLIVAYLVHGLAYRREIFKMAEG